MAREKTDWSKHNIVLFEMVPKEVKTFKSIAEAVRETGLSQPEISKSLSGTRKLIQDRYFFVRANNTDNQSVSEKG